MAEEFIPRKFQEPIIHDMCSNDHFGVWAFPGSGKTAMSLLTVYHYRQPTLIVAPLSILYGTWVHEYKKWTFCQSLKISVLHGPDKDRNFHKKAGIYLINPEGIDWLFKKIAKSKRFPWKILIIDESTKFKAHTSGRFKLLKKFVKTFKKTYLLAANPIPNGYMDLWAQVFLLDYGERLKDSPYKYRDKYFYPTDFKRYNWVLKPGAEELITEKISDICTFLDMSDEIDLPERNVIKMEYDLPQKAQAQYKTMEKKLFTAITELDEYSGIEETRTNVLAKSRGVANGKCVQIAGGFLYENLPHPDYPEDETKFLRKTHQLHNEIDTLVKGVAESLEGSNPLLITYFFGEELKRLKKLFPDAPCASSGLEAIDFVKQQDAWNANELPIWIAHINKISHGCNLQYGKGNNIFMYCPTYNYDTFDQMVRRLQRQNAQFSHVNVYVPIAKGTVHEAMMAALDEKKSSSDEFFELLLERRQNESMNS